MENKITDKGWEKMRVMLDREMPEKARRIFAWWWFLILLIPVTGFGGWKWASARTELLQNSGTRPVQAFADSPLFKLNSSENTPSNTPLTRLSTTPLAEPNAPMQSAQHSNKRNFKGNFTYAPTSLENKQVMVEELPAVQLHDVIELQDQVLPFVADRVPEACRQLGIGISGETRE